LEFFFGFFWQKDFFSFAVSSKTKNGDRIEQHKSNLIQTEIVTMGPLDLDDLFSADDLLNDHNADIMLDMTDEEFLNGVETPLTSMAVFDDEPGMFVPQMEPSKPVLAAPISPRACTNKASAIKMISYLQEQLRAKDSQIQQLQGTFGGPASPLGRRARVDELDQIVADAVAAVDSVPEEEWITSPAHSKQNKRKIEPLDAFTINRAGPVDRSGDDLLVSPRVPRPPYSKKQRKLAKKAVSEPVPRKIKRELSVDSDTTRGYDSSSPCSSHEKPKKVARRWTASQDDELRHAVQKHNGQNWKAIAQMVKDRDHVQCLQRWKKVLQPGLVKGMWSKQEDELLLKLMSSSRPKNWADIAIKVPGRTAKQCRERWSLNLDPSINRGAWTQAEDELLLSLHKKLGNKWAEIKRHLSGRTENGVKTRFKSIERAKFKDTEVVWTPELEAQLHDIAVRFECRIDEVAKHLPRVIRGISSQAMRDHCPLLRNSEAKSTFVV